jgi:hypothetical protein
MKIRFESFLCFYARDAFAKEKEEATGKGFSETKVAT